MVYSQVCPLPRFPGDAVLVAMAIGGKSHPSQPHSQVRMPNKKNMVDFVFFRCLVFMCVALTGYNGRLGSHPHTLTPSHTQHTHTAAPVEMLSLYLDLPWMLVVDDFRHGLLTSSLFLFWIILVGEHTPVSAHPALSSVGQWTVCRCIGRRRGCGWWAEFGELLEAAGHHWSRSCLYVCV